MRHLIFMLMLMLILGTSVYAQEQREYTLFVGEFENRTGIVNPLLDFVNDTLDFLFSRSQLAEIHPISPGLRSAYLQRARYEQPNVDAIKLNLLAADYGKADAVLVGSYSKTGRQWSMDAQLYVMRGGSRAKEDIHLSGDNAYSLLDGLAAEVSKRLGTGQYTLLSTPSWEAYEAYRQGHQAYYNFDLMAAIDHFLRAIELDPKLAVAQVELAISYWMLSKHDDARAMFAEAMRNLQSASEPEQTIVIGLKTYYDAIWYPGRGANSLAGPGTEGPGGYYDMPRMGEDTVWDEPWLLWYVIHSKDAETTSREYKRWLTSALAYAGAGFYDAAKLANQTIERCLAAFDATKDPQFLEAALQFAGQAADMKADDEYDDAWRHWELTKIYGKMEQPENMQEHKGKWLQAVKHKAMDSVSPNMLNDIAGKCLKAGLLKEGAEFVSRALELGPDPEIRAICLVTLGDIRSASGELNEAFRAYVEAFEVSARGDAGTDILSDSLSGLTRLVRNNPGFVDEAKRAELNEIMKAIENMDPLLFRSDSAVRTIEGVVLRSARDFCLAMGDIGPVLTILRGLFKAEMDPSEQLEFLTYLSTFAGGITESERKLASSPEFIQSITALNDPAKLDSLHEIIGE